MINNPDITKVTSRGKALFDYLQKQRENKKITKFLEIGFTFLLVSFFTLFAIKPTVLTISTLLGDIKSKELLNKQLKTKINDIIMAQDLFSQVQERYLLVESSLPNNPHFYQATSQILTSSQNNQIYLDKISYLVQDQNYFSTTISTTSSFLSVVSLLSDIQQNRRLIDINNLTLSLGKNPQNQKININLPLKIYYWPNNVKN